MSTGAEQERAERHLCHARNCDTRVPPRMFMCKRHWFMLPKAMRDSVWAEYRPGQERRMDPTDAYLAVVHDCIEHVAEREMAAAWERNLNG